MPTLALENGLTDNGPQDIDAVKHCGDGVCPSESHQGHMYNLNKARR